MAAVNFPNNPSVNDTHTSSGSTWKWDGTVWQRLGEAGPQGAQGVQGAAGAAGAQGAAGTGTGTADKIFEGNTNAEVVDTGSDGHFKVTTEGSERIRINSSGQVSIGNNPTVASDAALHIELDGTREYLRLEGDGGTSNAYLEIEAPNNRRKAIIFKSGGTRRGVIGVGDSDEASATSLFFSASSNIAGNSPHMVIDSSGRLLKSGLASLTSTSLNHPIQVAADAEAQNICIIGRASDDIGEISYYEADKSTRLGELQYRRDHLNFRHRVGYMSFCAGGTTEQLRLTSDGQIGVNNTSPDAWHSTYKSVQIYDAAVLYGSQDDSFVGLGANHFLNTSGDFKYSNTDFASRFYQVNGGFHFESVASGTAGNTFSFTEKLKIAQDGTTTATGTSDGVLQLDTSDSRGAFIRFGQGGSYHHMIGCADGLVAGPDKEDLGLRAADNMVFCTNGANEKLRITAAGDMGLGCSNPGADPAIGNDATVFEIRQTTSGNITSGNNRKGAVLRLKHEAQWENGYQSSSPNDDLGRVEFVTGDNSTGEGVRSVIRCRNLNYFNSQALTFEVATANSTSLEERLRIKSDGNIIPGTNNATSIGDGTTNFNSIWASTRFRGNDNVKLVLGNAQDLVIRHDGTNNIIGSPVGGDLHIKSGTGDNDNQLIAAFKHSNGYMGVGTDNPNRLLTLYGDTGIALQNSTTGTGNANGTHIWVNSTGNGELLIQNRESSPIKFYTSDQERLRIDSGGRLGLGVTPKSWHSNNKGVIQGNGGYSILGRSDNFLGIYQNFYYDASDAGKYIANGEASAYFQNDGAHKFYTAVSGSADASASLVEVFRIKSSGIAQFSTNGSYDSYSTANDAFQFRHGQQDEALLWISNTNSSHTKELLRLDSARSGSSSFDLATFTTGNLGDDQFRFRGDGNAYSDSGYWAGGADYAEYFEWTDGNSSDEDRRGMTVVLDGNKVKLSTSSDSADNIIGVVSASPVVVGDSAYMAWNGKYLRDEYGAYDLDENGERKLNPSYDDTKTYVTREDRKEWDTIGMVGKLRIRKGQKTGTRWIKMRDISASVEEWLVR